MNERDNVYEARLKEIKATTTSTLRNVESILAAPDAPTALSDSSILLRFRKHILKKPTRPVEDTHMISFREGAYVRLNLDDIGVVKAVVSIIHARRLILYSCLHKFTAAGIPSVYWRRDNGL
jgi:hypothetical protein